MSINVRFRPEFLEIIKLYISNKLAEASAEGAVVSVSGGLDSAVVLKICTLVLPQDKISAVFLPESTTPMQDTKDVQLLAKELNVKMIEISIDDILKKYMTIKNFPEPQAISLGNIKSRIRMNIIFYIANSLNRLVMGTSNKSELLLGYFTKYGDGASDVAPIGDLFKTQVVQLAEHLQLPKSLISKPPTAGLVTDQTDEEDLGLDYNTIDKILFTLERDMSPPKIAEKLAIAEAEVIRIKNRVEQNRHKRKFPKIPKLDIKTIGVDLYE
jgi:NAD+ synthase